MSTGVLPCYSLSSVGRGRCLEEQTVTMVGLARFSLTLAFYLRNALVHSM